MNEEILNNIWNTLNKDSNLNLKAKDFEEWKNSFIQDQNIQTNVYNYLKENYSLKASNQEEWTTNLLGKTKGSADATPGVEPVVTESGLDVGTLDLPNTSEELNATLLAISNGVTRNHFKVKNKLAEKYFNLENFNRSRKMVKSEAGILAGGGFRYAKSEEEDLKSFFGDKKYKEYLRYKETEVFDSNLVEESVVKEAIRSTRQEEIEQYTSRLDVGDFFTGDKEMVAESRRSAQEGVFNIFDPEDGDYLQMYTEALEADRKAQAAVKDLRAKGFTGTNYAAMKIKQQGSKAEKVLEKYFNTKFSEYEQKSRDWEEKYNDYININSRYEGLFSRIKSSIDALGEVDEYSSKEKIQEYNNLIQQGDNLSAEYRSELLSKNINIKEISKSAEILQSNFDKLVDNFDKVSDITTISKALALDYGWANRTSLSFETGIAEMTSLLSGTSKAFAWVLDRITGNQDIFSNFAKKQHAAVIDYNESLREYKQVSLPLNIDFDDVGLDNIGQWASQALANNAFSIGSALTYGGAIKLGANVARSTKILSGTFFGLEAGAKYTHMEIDQKNAPKMIKDLQKSLALAVTQGEKLEILNQIDYYQGALDATELQKAFSSVMYGGIAMYAERLGTMRILKNLNRVSPTNGRLNFANTMKASWQVGKGVGTEYFEEFATQVGHNLVDMTVLGQNKNLLDGIDKNFSANVMFSTLAIQGPSVSMNVYNTIRSEINTQSEIRENRARRDQIIEINATLQADQESGFTLLDNDQRNQLEFDNNRLIREAALVDSYTMAEVANMTAVEVNQMFELNQKKRDKLKEIQNLGATSAYEKTGSKYVKNKKEKLVNEIKEINAKRDDLRNKPSERRKKIIEDTLKEDIAKIDTEFYFGKYQGALNIVKGLGKVQQFGKINEDGTLDLTDLEAYLDKAIKSGKIKDKKLKNGTIVTAKQQKNMYLKGFREGSNASFLGNEAIVVEANIIRNINNAETAFEKSIAAYSPIHELQHINDIKTGLIEDNEVIESSKIAVEGIKTEVDNLYKQGKIKEKDYNTYKKRLASYSEGDLMELLAIAGELKNAGILSENSRDALLSFKLMFNQLSKKYFKKGSMFFKLDNTKDVLGYIDSFQRSTRNQTLILGPEEETKKAKFSRSAAVGVVNKIEQKLKNRLKAENKEYTQDEFRTSDEFNELFDSITEAGGAVNNYIKSLGMSKDKTKQTIQKVSDRLMGYNPQAKRKTGSKEAVTIGERIMSDTQFAKLDAARDLAIEGEKEGKTLRIDAAKRTKEGETTFDIEDTGIDPTTLAFETEDLSIEGQAKKSKTKKQKYSKFRRDLGFDTGSKIYNQVLDNVKKSLIIAYGATQNITDAQLRAKAIATKMKKEYSNLNSPLFKQIKNFITYGVSEAKVARGTKDIYISQLKKYREVIFENISTADLVQMEKKIPEVDRIFTKFVATLTSKDQVQDAVNKQQLPPDALNKITRDKKTGKGAYSVNLYQKIMPTETELVSFADQPGINPVTGARQGLKGTRKDGIVMRMVNSLVTDAIMEAEQSIEVQDRIANMNASSLSAAELGAAIGREVGVKFSKTTADVDILDAMNGIGDVNVYSQIKFSKAHRDQYEKQLTKRRPDLTEEQRKNAVQSVFDFIDGKDIPNNKKSKYEKLAMHYMANGYLILPEDGYKVIEAERIAALKKLDPFSFKNPNVLIETYVDQVKAVRTNPDNVKTFTNKTEYTNGVVVYDVEDSKQGQLDTRKVIDTHFGKKANPWCLCARIAPTRVKLGDEHNTLKEAQKEANKWIKGNNQYTDIKAITDGEGRFFVTGMTPGESLKKSFNLWKSYNKKGNGHQIAFQNGKLISFRDGNQMQWWDRMDNPTAAPIVKGKKAKDGFRPVVQAQLKKPGVEPKILKYEKVVGNSKTGSVIVKNIDGVIISETNTKNGKLHGKQFELTEAPSIDISVTSIYENGDRLSDKETRVYKDKKEVVKNTFGEDAIHLDNITSYERTNTYKDYISDLGKETIKVEGTVNQRFFKEFNDPSLAKGFTKTNLEFLTPAYERYYDLQGQKVAIEITLDASLASSIEDIRSGKLQTLKINGEQQDLSIKFSNGFINYNLLANNNKWTTLMDGKRDQVRKSRIAVRDIINSLPEESLEKDFFEIFLDNIQYGLTFSDIVNNTWAATSYMRSGNNILGILSDGVFTKDHLSNILGQIKIITEVKIKQIAFNNAVKELQEDVKKATTDSKKVNIIKDWLINNSKSLRTAKVKYEGKTITTNEQVFKLIIKPLNVKGFSFRELDKGTKITYNNEDLDTYIQIIEIKQNPASFIETSKQEAEQAKKWFLNILKSKLNPEVKMARLTLGSVDMVGPVRKIAPLIGYIKNYKGKTTLEHREPVNKLLKAANKYVNNPTDKNLSQVEKIIDNSKTVLLPNDIVEVINKKHKTTGDLNTIMGLAEVKEIISKKGYEFVGIPFSKSTQFDNLNNSINFSRSTNNEVKGITVLDFDDTLATSKSLIRFTRPDGTTGTLNAEQYASTYESLTELGYEFDFSEFTKVVEGKTAPLFNKALKLQSKFGPENMFILTARPAESAPAIFEFLKANGLNIPLKNITGLANSTAEAKANWIAGKVAEGYNDFYFADDALQNVKAVKNMLDQFDVKSKVQQAKIKFSNTMNDQFNDILEDVTGIEAIKRFSAIKARKRGASKGKFRFFIPPSHEDFVGLLYNFMGTGRQGDKHRDFFEKALVRPLNRAYREIDTAKQAIANDYKQLNKQLKEVKDKLNKKTPDGDFIFEDAIRVYLWNKHGYNIPGLSETDQANLVELVMNDSELRDYAETINTISKQDKYVEPGQGWEGGNIKTDLIDATGRVGRAEYFTEFNENADVLFSEENLNKIEAGYGADFRSALEDILHRIKTGVNRPKGQTGTVNKLMNYLNGSVGAVMFFNTRSAILQQMSIVNYINFADNNIFAAAKAFANQKQYWADFAFIFNSDMLKQRRGGIGTDINGADLAQAVQGSKNPTKVIIGKLLKLGFLPTQIGDNIAIATGGATYYRNRVNKYVKDGLKQKEAEAKAFTDFQDLTQSTQQSSRPDMTSQQQASWIGKLVLNFQNITSQYNRIIKKAALDIGKGRISPPYTTKTQSNLGNLSKILYYGAIQNVIFYSLQTALFAVMFDEDEDEDQVLKKRERVIQGTIDSILRGSGIYGAVLSTLKNAVIKWKEQREPNYNKDESAVLMELLNFSPVVGIKARKLVNAEKTINYNENVIREMETFDADNPQWSAVTNYTEALTNFPANRLYQKSINMRNALDKDYTMFQRIMFFSGYTTWSLGLGDNEAVIEAKEKIRINKANTKKRKKQRRQTKEEVRRKSLLKSRR